MRARTLIWVQALFVCTLFCSAAPSQQQSEFFEKQVRPVLANNCFACHAKARMGGLQLDSREHLMKGGQDGPVVVPGDPEKSLLIQAVRKTHERIKMPPQGKLSDREVDDLAAWVREGAVWPDSAVAEKQTKYWAFQPVQKPQDFAVASTNLSGLASKRKG